MRPMEDQQLTHGHGCHTSSTFMSLLLHGEQNFCAMQDSYCQIVSEELHDESAVFVGLLF